MDYLGLGLLIVLVVLFGLLVTRAWRIRRGVVRWPLMVASSLLLLLFGTALVLALVGYAEINTVRSNPVPPLTVQSSPQLIANGERFARACAGCHSSNGELPLGGQDFLGEEGGPPLGTVWASNLTPTHLSDWSDGEIVRAIREGVGRDGRSLVIMPASEFHNMSDEDVLSLVAYLRSQPAIEPDNPPRQLNVLAAILFATVLPDEFFSAQPPITASVVAPPRGPTAEYGAYLSTLGCQGCHGQNLAGVPPSANGPPPGPNLTTVSTRLTADQFVALLRTGMYPDGRPLGDAMPWKDYEKFSDDDFRALYAHLASLEPLPPNQ